MNSKYLINRLVTFGISTLLLILTTKLAATDISGAISGTLTAAGNPYIVTGDLTVPAGDSLTIEEGVEMRFNANLKMTTNGELQVNGTGESPVTFTSNEATPARGDWEMVEINGPASIVNAVFTYASGALSVTDSPSYLISSCSFSHNSLGTLIEVNTAGGSGTITGCYYQDNDGYGILFYGWYCKDYSLYTISDCTFDGNREPISFCNHPPSISGLTIYPNQTRYNGVGVNLGGGLICDLTLTNIGVPYVLENGDLNSIPSLTIEKGVILQIDGRLQIMSGILAINGTASEPVIMESLSGAGFITLEEGSAVITHAVFRNSGDRAISSGPGNSYLDISNCLFEDNYIAVESYYCPLGSAVTISNSVFQNNTDALKFQGIVTAIVSGCRFNTNSGTALRCSAGFTNGTVSNCDFSGNGTAVYFDATSTANLGSTASGGGYNQFLCNGVNVNSLGSSLIMAENNWWGASPPDASKIIGNVDYTPYLTGPVRDVLTDMTVSLSGSSDVSLVWPDLSNGCGYRVLRSALPNSGFADISGIISTAGFTDPGAASIPGVLYYKVELQ